MHFNSYVTSLLTVASWHTSAKRDLLLLAVKELWFEEKETSEQDCWSGPQEASAKQLTSSEIVPDSQFFTDLDLPLVPTLKNKPAWHSIHFILELFGATIKGKILYFPLVESALLKSRKLCEVT